MSTKKKPITEQEIVAAWNMFEDAEPDISTERLMQQTASHCRCDAGDVAEALWNDQQQCRARKEARK